MNHKEFFAAYGSCAPKVSLSIGDTSNCRIEDLYQAFKARLMDELALSEPIPVIQGYFSKGDGDGGSKISKSQKREIERLRAWIAEEGNRSNTCTKSVLGEVCENCRCGKA